MGQKRAVIIVLDSMGVGALPDFTVFDDEHGNTLGNTAKKCGGLNLPHLGRLGLGNIVPVSGVPASAEPLAAYGKMSEISQGKDTTTGHWEMAGIYTEKPLPVYPNGFPEALIKNFSAKIGRAVLCNKPSSGIEVIEKYGDEHMRSGALIVYTSMDSVFQIAAHEEIIPIEELYNICLIARNILIGENEVGRVIARPFLGQSGGYYRSDRRRDFSIEPPQGHLLDRLAEAGIPVITVGKISDVFAGRSVSVNLPAGNNQLVYEQLIYALGKHKEGLIFANFNDFDSKYGHRNDYAGYGKALEVFDSWLSEILSRLNNGDILFITADHGNDPTTASTDHNREYVPLLIYGGSVKKGVFLGTRETFADLGGTVADYLGVPPLQIGKSMLPEISIE